MASDQCAELTEFNTKLRDQIRASDQSMSMFVEKQFKRDVRTGQTPARRNDLQFPTEFVQPTPEELRKKKFRAQFAPREIVAKMDFENVNDEDLVENDAVFSEGSLNDTGESEVYNTLIFLYIYLSFFEFTSIFDEINYLPM